MKKNCYYALLSLQEPFFFLVQSSKLSMQCNFSDHIVAFGSDSEWLSDISTAALLCSAKIAPAVSPFAF